MRAWSSAKENVWSTKEKRGGLVRAASPQANAPSVICESRRMPFHRQSGPGLRRNTFHRHDVLRHPGLRRRRMPGWCRMPLGRRVPGRCGMPIGRGTPLGRRVPGGWCELPGIGIITPVSQCCRHLGSRCVSRLIPVEPVRRSVGAPVVFRWRVTPRQEMISHGGKVLAGTKNHLGIAVVSKPVGPVKIAVCPPRVATRAPPPARSCVWVAASIRDGSMPRLMKR